MAKTVVVIGAGGHGKVVVSTLQEAGLIVDAIYDDRSQLWGSQILGVRVCGPIAELANSPSEFAGVVGIGDGRIRQRLVNSLKIDWLTAIHPQAYVHHSAKIGRGTVVFAGAVVQPNATIGEHVIVNTCASVDHDCQIDDFVGLGPGTHLSGSVKIARRSLLGTGCCVLPNVRIESDVTVGAGTVVIHDVPSGCTIVGPAPRIIQNASQSEPNKAA